MVLTEDKLKFVIENWQKMTSVEMAKELGVPEGTIYYWTSLYRNMGGVLPRKAGMAMRLSETLIAKYLIAQGITPVDKSTKKPFEFVEKE